MPRMPALFIGHGSPMNAIEDNAYSLAWKELGKSLPRPRAILVVSAQERPIPIGAGGNGGHAGRAFLVRFIARFSGFCFMADRPGEAGLRHS